MTSPNRPPSCDLLLPRRGGAAYFSETPKPKLKECPFCGGRAIKHQRLPVIKCISGDCLTYGPSDDLHGTKWNSIPRRSEVAELLRLVDEYISGRDGYLELSDYADKLRKEWNQ